MSYPLWASPQRRQALVELFLRYGNRCLEGHPACSDLRHYLYRERKVGWVGVPVKVPVEDKDTGLPKPGVYLTIHSPRKAVVEVPKFVDGLYSILERESVQYWKADDREERSYLWKLEKRRMHAAPKIRRRGEWDSIRQEQYLAELPAYRVLAIGVNAFTQRRTAKVEIPALRKIVWVDIGEVHISRNKLRKIRRGGTIPDEVYQHITRAVRRLL